MAPRPSDQRSTKYIEAEPIGYIEPAKMRLKLMLHLYPYTPMGIPLWVNSYTYTPIPPWVYLYG
jgi:hypothetical protein